MNLWQVNVHLQDALLTNLPGQFIKIYKSKFFQRLKNWPGTVLFFFFPTAFENLWSQVLILI